MASRRIQPSIQGAPDPTQIIASPVNTFVSPGAAGMPQAPVGRIGPAQPSMQGAQDLQALAQAFGGLSGSLADLGKSFASLERAQEIQKERADREARIGKSEDRAEEAEARRLGVEMAEEFNITELQRGTLKMSQLNSQFSALLERNQITVGEHPAFRRAFSRALAARLSRSDVSKDKVDFQAVLDRDAEEAEDPKFVDRFLTPRNQEAILKLPEWVDKDAFAGSYLNHRAETRPWFEASHNVWLRDKVAKAEADDIKYTAQEALDNVWEESLKAPNDQIVFDAGQGVGGKLLVNPALPKDVDYAQMGADKIMEFLDSLMPASTLTPEKRNQQIARALVEYIVETPELDKKKWALEVFKKVLVGPPSSRSPLSKTGAARDYFKENEDRIASSIESAERAILREKEAQAKIALQEEVEKKTKAWDQSRKITVTNIQQELSHMLKTRSGVPSSSAMIAEDLRAQLRAADPSNPIVKFITASNGVLEGDDILFVNPIDESETRYKISSLVNDAVATAHNDLFRSEYAILKTASEDPENTVYRYTDAAGQSNPLDDDTLQLIAQVHATQKLGLLENNTVRSAMRNAVVLQSDMDQGVNATALDGGLRAFREMTAFQPGSHLMARNILGDMYDVYSIMDSLTQLGEFGGGGMAGVERIAQLLGGGALSSDAIAASNKMHQPFIEMAFTDPALNEALMEVDNPAAARARVMRLTGLYLHLSGATPDSEASKSAALRVTESMRSSTMRVRSTAVSEYGARYLDVSRVDPRLVNGTHPEMEEVGVKESLSKFLTEVQTTLTYGVSPLDTENRRQKPGPLTKKDVLAGRAMGLYKEILQYNDTGLFRERSPYFKPIQGAPGEDVKFILYVPFPSAVDESGIGYRVASRASETTEFTLEELLSLRLISDLRPRDEKKVPADVRAGRAMGVPFNYTPGGGIR